MTQVTPIQEKLLEPYSQRLYAGDINDSKSYIYSYVNNLTTVIGEDIIVKGCEITNLSDLTTDYDISFKVTPGLILHDRALIEIESDSVVTYKNACNFSDSGKFIVFTRFKNYTTNEENKLQIGITYIGNNQVIHEDFDINTDRIILGVIELSKDGQDAIVGTNLIAAGYITINKKEYNIRPFRTDYNINTDIVWDGNNP